MSFADSNASAPREFNAGKEWVPTAPLSVIYILSFPVGSDTRVYSDAHRHCYSFLRRNLAMPIVLKDIQQFPNGAGFHTADLHIHSFGGSADVKDSGMSVEAIVDHAVAAGISLISITDHNSDKNLQAALDYAQKYAGQLLVLPGVEITTSMSIPNVVAEVERLGGISISAHIDRDKTGFEAIIQGYPNSKRDILVSSGLYGLEFDDSSHLVWYSPDDEPTSDGSERKKLLSARHQSTATAARVRLAAVQNSDSHSVAQLAGKHTLTRFKMNELTFEGLRTALIGCVHRLAFLNLFLESWGCKRAVASWTAKPSTSATTSIVSSVAEEPVNRPHCRPWRTP
ncbi:MAG: hypothetical protein DMG96_04305 [Acidobacteria bacterium]|nr:MAG: hypothetical protein DMG96_04305 [Acidobacteriota bacterium]